MKFGGNVAAKSTAECPRYSAANATEIIESHIEFGSTWIDSLASPISGGRNVIAGPKISSHNVVGDTMLAR